MIWYLLSAVAGILLWAMLAPTSWQLWLRDVAHDFWELLKAWGKVGWQKLRERV